MTQPTGSPGVALILLSVGLTLTLWALVVTTVTVALLRRLGPENALLLWLALVLATITLMLLRLRPSIGVWASLPVTLYMCTVVTAIPTGVVVWTTARGLRMDPRPSGLRQLAVGFGVFIAAVLPASVIAAVPDMVTLFRPD